MLNKNCFQEKEAVIQEKNVDIILCTGATEEERKRERIEREN